MGESKSNVERQSEEPKCESDWAQTGHAKNKQLTPKLKKGFLFTREKDFFSLEESKIRFFESRITV